MGELDRAMYEWFDAEAKSIRLLEKEAKFALERSENLNLYPRYRRKGYDIYLRLEHSRRRRVSLYNRLTGQVNPCFFSEGGPPKKIPIR
jgi:hypothetical protein